VVGDDQEQKRKGGKLRLFRDERKREAFGARLPRASRVWSQLQSGDSSVFKLLSFFGYILFVLFLSFWPSLFDSLFVR
jgi:hypothetical protein